MDDLASKIRDRRKSLGMTQADFAEKIDIPNRTFQNYETGRNSIPANILPQIAKALECSVADLYVVQGLCSSG